MNYNELKDVIQTYGANSPNAQRKITELQNLSQAREDALVSSERERGREVGAVERAAQRAAEHAAERARQRGRQRCALAYLQDFDQAEQAEEAHAAQQLEAERRRGVVTEH